MGDSLGESKNQSNVQQETPKKKDKTKKESKKQEIKRLQEMGIAKQFAVRDGTVALMPDAFIATINFDFRAATMRPKQSTGNPEKVFLRVCVC